MTEYFSRILIAWGTHWRKVIENWINVAVLLCFFKVRF